MKKLYKKLISWSLALSLFAPSLPAFAMEEANMNVQPSEPASIEVSLESEETRENIVVGNSTDVTYKFLRDKDGVEVGEVYSIVYEVESSKRLLYCQTTNDNTTDRSTVTVNGEELSLVANAAEANQTWQVVSANDGYALKSISTSKYLDLSQNSSKGPAVNESPQEVVIQLVDEQAGKYTVVSAAQGGKKLGYEGAAASGKFVGGDTAVNVTFFKKTGIRTPGNGIANMFNESGDNIWVFTGGEDVVGGFEQVQGARNYIGHFEEYIRYGTQAAGSNRDMNHNKRQRYTINVGKAGRTLQEVVDQWEELILPNQPRAVSFFIGKEDYGKGESGLEAFINTAESFIRKAMALKNNTGLAVFQLPYKTGNAALDEKAALYTERLIQYVDAKTGDEYSRILLVDHFTGSQNLADWLGRCITGNGLNQQGHFEIGKQLAEATVKTSSNFPNGSVGLVLEATEYPRPEVYEEQMGPQVEAVDSTLKVKLGTDILASYGDTYRYELTVTDENQGKTVIENKVMVSEDGIFTINNIGKVGSSWLLQLRTEAEDVQLKSVEGIVGTGDKTIDHQPKVFRENAGEAEKKLAALLKSEEPMRWLFVGDSITHASACTNEYDGIAQLFEKYVRGSLGREDDVVINTAVADSNIKDYTNDARTSVRLDYDADVVFIMLGSNDACIDGCKTVAEFTANLNLLLEKVEEYNPNSLVVFRTPLYTWMAAGGSGRRWQNLVPLIDTMKNIGLEEDAKGNPKADFIIDQYTPSALALQDLLWMSNNGQGSNRLFFDQIHPNELGHVFMFRQLIAELGLWDNDSSMTDLLYDTIYTNRYYDETDFSTALSIDESEKRLTLDVNSLVALLPDLASVTLKVTNQATGQSWEKKADRIVVTNPSATQDSGLIDVVWGENTSITMEGLPWDAHYEIEITGWSISEAKEIVLSQEKSLGNAPEIALYMDNGPFLYNVDVTKGVEIGTIGVSGAEADREYKTDVISVTDSKGNLHTDLFEIKGKILKVKNTLKAGETYQVTIQAIVGNNIVTESFSIATVISAIDSPVKGEYLRLDTTDVRYLIYDIDYEEDGNPVTLNNTPYTRMLYNDDSGNSAGKLRYGNDYATTLDNKYLWKLTATATEAAYEMRNQKFYDKGWPVYAPYGEKAENGDYDYLNAMTRRLSGNPCAKNTELARVSFKVMDTINQTFGTINKELVYVAIIARGEGNQQGKEFYLSTEDGTFTSNQNSARWVEVPEDGNIPKDKGWWVLEEAPVVTEGTGDILGRSLLFRTSALEYHYRIPAIATANNGDLIAAIDYRFHSNADIGTHWQNWDGKAWRGHGYGHQIDLYTRLSKDNGASWESSINQTEEFSIAPSHYAKQDSNGYGDPALVADRESDDVLMVSVSGKNGYLQNKPQASYMLSEDNGKTFQEPVNISNQIYGRFDSQDTANYESALSGQSLSKFFFASGKIHQSRYVKVGTHYRIYSAILANYSTNCNYVMYSDDFGKNWHVLGNTTAIANGGDEAKIEELPNGDVVITSRITKGRKVNIFKYDQNDKTFKTGQWGQVQDMNLAPNCNNGCNGEVYVVYAKKADTDEYGYLIMQSLPTGSGRSKVKIFYRWLEPGANLSVAEFSDTSKWSSVDESIELQDGKSCYSTMILQADGKIGVVWEEGVHEYDIVYKSFDLSEITNGEYEGAFPDGGIGSVDTPYLVSTAAQREAVETVYANEKVHFVNMQNVTVSFDSQGGSEVSPVSINAYKTIELPEEPAREGYIFGGWYTQAEGKGIFLTENTKVKADTTVFAHWVKAPGQEVKVFTVSFNSMGGSDIASLTVNEGGCIELPQAPIRDGYTFGGWFMEAEGKGEEFTKETVVNGNITVYAYWIENEVPGTDDPGVSDNDPGVSDNDPGVSDNDPGVSDNDPGVSDNDPGVSDNDPGVSGNDPEVVIPEDIWVSGIEDTEYNGKKITFSNIKVYDGAQLLKEKVDYTISYKNNVNAYTFEEEALEEFEKQLANNPKLKEVTGFNSKKAPQVVLKMKGNYTGTKNVYFNIYPLDITELDSMISGDNENSASNNTVSGNETEKDLLGKTATFYIDDISSTYTGKKQKVTPVVLWQEGGRNLKLKKEFTVTPDLSTITASGEYTVTIKGTGNFTGERIITYTIGQPGEISVSKLSVKVPKAVPYTENAQEPAITVKNKKDTLVKDKDYTVEYENNEAAGVASIIITGTKGAHGGTSYIGTRRITFKINGTSMAKAKIVGMDKSYAFLREEIEPVDGNKVKVTVAGKTLTPETDYEIRYEKNVYKGTASVIVTGNPEAGYVGSKTFKFKIGTTQISTKGEDFEFSFKDSREGNTYAYTKGGVKPVIELKHKGVTLREGVDYTLSYKDANKLGKAYVVLKGKGDFTGSAQEEFNIIKKDTVLHPDRIYIDVNDKVEGKAFKQNFKVVDEDGKALSNNKDYRAKEAIYTLVSAPEGKGLDAQIGKPMTDMKMKLPAGCVVEITVKLTGTNYNGDVKGSYRIITAAQDISKAKIQLNSQEYTGEEVILSGNDIFKKPVVLKSGKTLSLEGENANIEIVRYHNNIKKGTAKVTFRGLEEAGLGGYRTVTFKITPKTVSSNWEGVFEDMLGILGTN